MWVSNLHVTRLVSTPDIKKTYPWKSIVKKGSCSSYVRDGILSSLIQPNLCPGLVNLLRISNCWFGTIGFMGWGTTIPPPSHPMPKSIDNYSHKYIYIFNMSTDMRKRNLISYFSTCFSLLPECQSGWDKGAYIAIEFSFSVKYCISDILHLAQWDLF